MPRYAAHTPSRRRKEPVFWNLLNRFLFLLAAVGLVIVIVLWFYPELTRRNELSANLENQKKVLAAEQAKLKHQAREVDLLENDKQYIETIARDKLDLMKTNETIFRFDPPKPDASPAESPASAK